MEKKLYNIRDGIRFYNIYNTDELDLFCSELSIFCNNWIRDGENLFFIKNLPNNDINLTKEELDYIYLLDQDCKNFEYLDINNRVNYLMENQKNDLLLIGLEKINFLFLIPKFDKNNCYYFDLFISFKNEYMHKNLLNLNFNIISIESVSKIKNLSLSDIKNIFNFDNNKFLTNKFDYRGVCTLNIDFNKKKLDIKPLTQEEEYVKMIEFLNECNNNGDINKNEYLKPNIKEILSQYLKKRDININLKKISYFFYWNTEIPDCWKYPDRPGYEFVLDDETGYSECYFNRIHVLCSDFGLNTYIK